MRILGFSGRIAYICGMSKKITRLKETLDTLASYQGDDPYMVSLKDRFVVRNTGFPNSFEMDYVLANKDYVPRRVDKVAELSEWYAQKMREKWDIPFVPRRVLVGYVFGETENFVHCYLKYKRNMERGVSAMIPRKALITDLFAEDYESLEVDFDKYDRLSTEKDPGRKLRDHQKTAVKFLLSRKKCVLADGMGLGKTTSLIVAALEGGFDRVVVVCPASVKTTWRKEFSWYVDPGRVSIVEGAAGMTKAELERFCGYEPGASGMKASELRGLAKSMTKWKDNDFVIINYDILDDVYTVPLTRSKANVDAAAAKSPLLGYFMSGKKRLLIVDEAHRLSNNTSIRYKVLQDLIKRAAPDGIYLATGTPITNRPLNFYHVLKLISHPVTKDWSFYVQNFCDARQIPAKGQKKFWTDAYLKKVRKPDWYSLTSKEKDDLKQYIRDHAKMIWLTNGASNLDELRERVKTVYLRRVKEDIPGMVRKSVSVRYYDMTMAQLMEYNKLWDDYEAAQRNMGKDDASLNRDLLEGALLRQYVSKIMVPYTETLVDELLEDGEKVIIACAFDKELYTLQEYYGDKCVIYNGKMSAKQKDRAQDAFMNDPAIKVFIGNIEAAGVGLTLTSSRYVVFNNMSFVPSDNDQMMDRVHRLSQSNDVEIIFQIFSDTIYEHIWDVVMSKQYVIDNVIKKEEEK